MSQTKQFHSKYARKQNYQTLNYPNPSPHRSPYHSNNNPSQDVSPVKRTLQQKQIQDLQHKVDIILQHNDKLSFQNQQLKRRLSQLQLQGFNNLQKQRISRYQIQDNEYGVRKLKSQLLVIQRENQILVCENNSIKEINKKEIQSLRVIISNLNINNQELKLENIKLMQEIHKIKETEQNEKKFALKELERKFHQDIAKLQKQKGQELSRERAYHSKTLQQLKLKFQQQKAQFNSRKATLITKLQDTHNKQINQLRQQMIAQFNQQLSKLQEESNRKCKEQRDKADAFIKEMMDNIQGNNLQENQLLKKQINGLEKSLLNRKNLIDQLLKNQLDQELDFLGFEEVKQLRKRLKQQTQHFMRQSQILKIRSAQKYEIDFKEMIKIYENKIEILINQNKIVTQQNDRIRQTYQQQIESKIKQRRTWQQQTGKLKNLIRKLKVELQGVHDQFRINIDFIKDQNATFSLTLMKSVTQDKQKANFFEEENRKLRSMYDKHEQYVQQEKKQAEERVKFYQSKFQGLKNTIEKEKLELLQKEEAFQKILDARQQFIRQTLRNQRFQMQARLIQMQNQRLKYQRQCFDARNKLEQCEISLKQAKSEIEYYIAKLRQNQGHIQHLRMELQMAGIDDNQKNDAINQWKQHYENIILSLESDKNHLKGINDTYSSKMERLVFKYHLLEAELKKGSESLLRRSELDSRVIQLGMDENLIKNMGAIWKKDHNFQ